MLLAASFATAQTEPNVSIAVSRNGTIENLKAPRTLADAILKAARVSAPSSQKDPVGEWEKVFVQPNWIHAQFSPALLLDISGKETAVSEILLLFPTRDAGRGWPSFMMLKTDASILSRAKWSACQMRAIATAAGFDPKAEAAPFNTYCPNSHRYSQ